MLLGQIEGRDVVVMQGRFHPYEGHPYWRAAIYVWVLHQLGVQALVLTNASGGLNRSLHVGQLCLIKDHLDLPGCSGGTPLYGMSDARLFRERFVAMAGAYDRTLRRSLLAAARSLGFGDDVTEGVYAVRSGPNYETPAEGRMLLRMGADVVGMSTVFEAAAARAVGLRVLGLSLVTNLVSLDDESADDPEQPAVADAVHAEVIEQSRLQISKIKAILTTFIKQLDF
jgi:purine-nucleoside phosphorylase